MTTKTEALQAGGFVISEANGNRSREGGTLISGQNLGAATVLGKIIAGAATSAAKGGGNTGGGTCTMDATTPTLRGAQVGVYTARVVALVANGGLFEVKDPYGKIVGMGKVGTAFANQIKFVLADVGTDFALDDGFDITVPAAAAAGKYTQLAPAALDGSAEYAGVQFAPVDATGADKPVTVIARAAELNVNEIVWPAGISAANKAIAVSQMVAVGVILR